MDAVTMERHYIALRLGLSLDELGSMAVSDFLSWRAYFKKEKSVG